MQPTRSGPPAWGLGEVLTTSHRKKVSCYETHSNPRTWNDTLVRLKQRKKDMRFDTWNVRSLYRAGYSQQQPGN